MLNASESELRETPPAVQGSIRVLIVDDHAILRAGVREMLTDEEDLQVVGEAGSAEEALQLLDSGTKVDVVVLDITLPGQSGIELLKHLRAERPDLQILVL